MFNQNMIRGDPVNGKKFKVRLVDHTTISNLSRENLEKCHLSPNAVCCFQLQAILL